MRKPRPLRAGASRPGAARPAARRRAGPAAARLAALAVVTSLLAACAPSVTLVSDPVFAELYLSESGELRRFERAARNAGYTLRTVTLEAVPPSREAVDAALSDTDRGQSVVLSPLLAAVSLTRDALPEGEGQRVLLLGGQEAVRADATARAAAPAPAPDDATDDADAAHDGVSRAVHERVPAFTELGRRLSGLSLIAYFRSDTAARRAELDAFRNALGAGAESARFVVFENAPDDTAVREELFRVRSPDVDLVASFIGPRNHLILDEIGGMDGTQPLVATEDLGPAVAGYQSLAVLSVERDFANALEAFLSGGQGDIIVESRVLDRDGDRDSRVP